ncbi:MAG: TonB family protein [Cyclobacteriaceae bacterium]
MNKQRYDIDEAWVQRYREGALSEEEQAWLQDHPFEAEALEGLAETLQWSRDVSELQLKLQERTTKQRNLWGVYSRYAAGLALLITVGWFAYRFALQGDTPISPASDARFEEPLASENFMQVPETLKKVAGEGAASIADQSYIAQAQQLVKPVPIPEQEDITTPAAASSPMLEENLALADGAEMEEERGEENSYSRDIPVLSQKMSGAQVKSRTAVPPEQFGHHIAGSVFSADDRSPLPGVNVIVKGTLVGTVTDMDGYFSVPVPDSSDATLLFSFIGFVPEEVAIDQRDSLAIVLEPDLQSLSEVVEVGYGKSDDAVSQSAYPVPSKKAFREYLETQLRYPEEARQNNIEGTVKVRFTVRADGQLTDFDVKKSLGYGCDEEAIRLIQKGPEWQPALREGQSQAQEVTVKVRFKSK